MPISHSSSDAVTQAARIEPDPSLCAGGVHCPLPVGPRGCPGPRGPEGPQPSLSDSLDSDDAGTAASSRAVKTLAEELARLKTHVRMPAPAGGLTLHVREDGHDSMDGLSATTAKRSYRAALAELRRYDPGDANTTLAFGPGRFDTGDHLLTRAALGGHHRLSLSGAGQDLTALHNNGSQYLIRTYGTDVRLDGLTLEGEIYASEHAYLVVHNSVLVAARSNFALINAQRKGVVLVSDITVRGDCTALMYARGASLIQFEAKTLTFADTPAYSVAVAYARNALISWTGTCIGTCTGRKFREAEAGRVTAGGKDPNTVIPGTVDG